MQMSKQERIIIIVLLVLVILGVGIFVFILPNFNNIDVNNKNLATAQSNYSSILEKLEREKTIDSDIKAAYEEGKDLADGFYNDLTTVDADEIMRQFIAKGKDIRISGLDLSPFSTEALSISVFAPSEVTYPLKDFSNTVIGGAAEETVNVENMSERDLINYAKEVMALALAISEPVTVGVANVSFTAYSDDLQNLHDFADMLNEGVYDDTIVDADGKPQRKATYLNGAEFELTDKSADITINAYGNASNVPTESVEEETSDTSSEATSGAQDTDQFGKYSMDFNVKLYCIEPVADPFGNSSQSE